MLKILVDADLILEALLNRSGFITEAEQVYEILQSQQVQGYISELGLDKIDSVLRRFEDSDTAKEIIAEIEDVVEVCPLDPTLMQQARSLNIRDFESAVEVICTHAFNCNAIVTYNSQKFEGANVPIWKLDKLSQMIDVQNTNLLRPYTNLLLLMEKRSSETFSTPKPVYCVEQRKCQRTWIINKLGVPIAYAVLHKDAEAWLNTIDEQRDDLIHDLGMSNRWKLLIYDAWWTLDLIIGAIAVRVKWFS